MKKSYGSFELGPVDLQIGPGLIGAVVGPNGGKSPLFGMLMNLIQPGSGEASLFGLDYPGDEVELKQKVGPLPVCVASPSLRHKLPSYFLDLENGSPVHGGC